jgi:hypothetical protein
VVKSDLHSMLKIMASDTLPHRLVCGKQLSYVSYGFDDASRAGFGSSWKNKDGLSYQFGIWGKDAQGRSSNYHEL